MPFSLRLTAAVVFFLAAAMSQQPGNKKPAPPPGPCDAAQTQMEITSCWDNLAQKADARLNALYQKLQKLIRAKMAEDDTTLKGYRSRALEKLKAAELAWVHYRDAQCDAAEQQYEGGTIAPSIHAGCVTDLTDQRITELQKTYAIYLVSQ